MPTTPYYAVIFTSKIKEESPGYEAMAEKMEKLAATYPGFLGIQSVREPNGLGITVSYWKTLDDISRWKADAEHLKAQAKGKSDWYSSYEVRICKVERQYDFTNSI